MYTSLQ